MLLVIAFEDGKQEDTAIGYNPQKPGRPSHHPLAGVIGGTRLCLHMEWRKGNNVSASGWIEAMEKVWRSRLPNTAFGPTGATLA